MELGTLTTSAAKGHIFYFIVDDQYPDEPRSGRLRYFYVVSESSSYTEAFSFLCHSLCDTKNDHRMRRWYQLYLRVFGSTTFITFSDQVQQHGAAEQRAAGEHDEKSMQQLPQLFHDEASARLALESFAHGLDASFAKKRLEISARQQNSSTPEKKTSPARRERQASLKGLPAESSSSPDAARQQQHMAVAATTRPYAKPNSGTAAAVGEKCDLPIRPAALSNVVASAEFLPVSQNFSNTSTSMDISKARGPLRSSDSGRDASSSLRGSRMKDSEKLWEDVAMLRKLLESERGHRKSNRGGESGVGGSSSRHKDASSRSSEPAARLLETQLKELTALCVSEREAHVKDVESWRAEVNRLQKQVSVSSHEHGERLQVILKENQQAVDRLEKQLQESEEMMRRSYDEGIQSRDIRIAQLSEDLLKAEHAARQASSEVDYYRRKCEDMEARVHQESQFRLQDQNRVLQQEVMSLKEEVRRLFMNQQTAAAAAVHYSSPQSSHVVDSGRRVERELYDAQATISHQRAELERAAYLVDALRDGLYAVKTEIPSLRKELHQVQHAGT